MRSFYEAIRQHDYSTDVRDNDTNVSQNQEANDTIFEILVYELFLLNTKSGANSKKRRNKEGR